MNKKWILAVVMIAALLVLSGCFGKKVATPTQPTPVVQEKPVAVVNQPRPVPKTVTPEEKGVVEVMTTAKNPTILQDQPYDSPKRNDAQAAGCSDSDGGVDYFKQGTVKDVKGSVKEDQCSRSEVYTSQLYEYFCAEDGGYKRVYYTCEKGCMNGACVE